MLGLGRSVTSKGIAQCFLPRSLKNDEEGCSNSKG